jgi:hypothetical protein
MYIDIKEDSGSGTTVDDYTTAVSIDVRARRLVTIHLRNTHATRVLTYQVLGYAKKGGTISTVETTGADLAGETTIQLVYTKKLATLVLQVKSKVGSTPATYAYEYLATVM